MILIIKDINTKPFKFSGSELLNTVEFFHSLTRDELKTMPLFDLEKKSKLFIARCSIFELESNQNETSEKLLALLQVSILELLENLKSRQSPVPSEAANSESGSKKMETDNEDKKEETDLANNKINSSDVNDDQPKEAKTKRVLKRKFMSCKKSGISIQCPYCNKTYKSIKSLQFHARDQHPNDRKLLAKDFEQASNDSLTECLMKDKKNDKLCKRSFTNDQMPKHLKTHDEKQPPNKKFRGFITSNDGASFSVVWRAPNENDPPEEEEIDTDGVLEEEILEVKVEESKEVETSNRDPNLIGQQKTYPGKQIRNVLLSEAQGEFHDSVGLFQDYDFSAITVDPADVLTELDSYGIASQVNIEELEMNSSFGIIRSQESDILLEMELSPDQFYYVENVTGSNDDFNNNQEGEGAKDLETFAADERAGEGNAVKFEAQVTNEAKAAADVNVESLKSDSGDIIEYDEDDIPTEDVDSDFYEEDDPIFTMNRTEMKKKRYLRRNLEASFVEIADLPGNISIVNGFRDYLTKKCNLSSNNDKNSTLSLSMGHLFLYNDSYLNFLTSKDESFRLDRLFDFNNDSRMITISSPLNWIAVTGGATGKERPSRQLEQLKSHARLREYLEHKLNDVTFNGQGLIKKLGLTRNNEDISKEIERLKVRKKLMDLYNSAKDKKKRMNQILVPETDMNEYEAVKTWFQSSVSKDKEEEAVKIWKESIRDHKKISERKFNKVASLARFTLAICDKSRPSSYSFTNEDYFDKVRVWLPEDKIKDMWILDNVPTKWKMYTAPNESTEPSCFEIRLYASHEHAILKSNQFTPLIMNKKCYQLIEMYLDMKRIVLKSEATVHEEVFFVNYRGRPMARLQKSKGNLVDLFGSVTGNPNFKLTSLRKASEGVIQGKSQLAEVGKDLNYHHSSVVPTYDNISCTRRTVFVSSLNENEGSSSMANLQDEDLEDHMKARKQFELEESNKRKEGAKKYLESEKKKKKVVDLTPLHLTKNNVDFLQSLFTDDNLTGILKTNKYK